jgi:hypothetical protein
MQLIPVHSSTGHRLMPCHAARARQLIRAGKAIKRHDRGIVYLVLLMRETGETQPIAVGVDPGSKKEALTVQSEAHTFLNIQADAVTWVKAHVKTRRQMRRLRRYRNTPCRKCRPNRLRGHIRFPPSTRARWGWKVRLLRWLARHYPITGVVIEDTAATTRKGRRRWNASFSPLQVGKLWFYGEVEQLAALTVVPSHFTSGLRDQAGLTKSHSKLSDRWDAHCVDSFVLASYRVSGPSQPTSTAILYITPLQFHRRQLHRLEKRKGGVRAPYGGTRSLGLKRGSWVRHPKYGITYVGGTRAGKISLHDMQTGKRLTDSAKKADCQVLCTASWRVRERMPGAPPHS